MCDKDEKFEGKNFPENLGFFNCNQQGTIFQLVPFGSSLRRMWKLHSMENQRDYVATGKQIVLFRTLGK